MKTFEVVFIVVITRPFVEFTFAPDGVLNDVRFTNELGIDMIPVVFDVMEYFASPTNRPTFAASVEA